MNFEKINLQDTRRSNQTHLLSDIMIMAFFAILGGENDYFGIADFCKHRKDLFFKWLKIKEIPSHDTFNRVFKRKSFMRGVKMSAKIMEDVDLDWMAPPVIHHWGCHVT